MEHPGQAPQTRVLRTPLSSLRSSELKDSSCEKKPVSFQHSRLGRLCYLLCFPGAQAAQEVYALSENNASWECACVNVQNRSKYVETFHPRDQEIGVAQWEAVVRSEALPFP